MIMRAALCGAALFLIACGKGGQQQVAQAPIRPAIAPTCDAADSTLPPLNADLDSLDVRAFVDVCLHFTGKADTKALGANKVEVVVTPDSRVHAAKQAGWSSGHGYIAARFDYKGVASPLFASWAGWTHDAGPAYLWIGPRTGKGDFNYRIFTVDPSKHPFYLRRSFGVFTADPKAPLDSAEFGVPAAHRAALAKLVADSTAVSINCDRGWCTASNIY